MNIEKLLNDSDTQDFKNAILHNTNEEIVEAVECLGKYLEILNNVLWKMTFFTFFLCAMIVILYAYFPQGAMKYFILGLFICVLAVNTVLFHLISKKEKFTMYIHSLTYEEAKRRRVCNE